MKLMFLLAQSSLENKIYKGSFKYEPEMKSDFHAGIYLISAELTHAKYSYHDYEKLGFSVFVLHSEPESAFVYAPYGLDAFVYNEGTSGKLIGDWYWITED